MRADRLAERFLALLVGDQEAAAVTGDLIEDVGGAGPAAFWMATGRMVWALWWRSFSAAPIRFVATTLVGWFAYMALTLALASVAFLVIPLAWAVFQFALEHTGLELIVGLILGPLGLDAPGPIGPVAAMRWSEWLTMLTASPFLLGRMASRSWPGREVMLWTVAIVVWPVLVSAAQFVGWFTRIDRWMMPVILVVILAGALWERRSGGSHRPGESSGTGYLPGPRKN